MKTEDKIQAYLDGEMTDIQVSSFKEELENDPSLKKQYDNYLLAKELSKGLLEIDMRETLEIEAGRNSSIPSWIWFVVLLVISCIGLYFIIAKINSEDTLFAESYTEPIWPIKRSVSDSLSAALAEWKATGILSEASKNIKEIESLDITMKNYWLAEMFLNTNEFDSARVFLPEVPSDHIKFQRIQKLKEWLSSND